MLKPNSIYYNPVYNIYAIIHEIKFNDDKDEIILSMEDKEGTYTYEHTRPSLIKKISKELNSGELVYIGEL